MSRTGPTPRGAPPAVARDRALLLRRTPYGETSLVVHALTPEHGRIELIAKGAYRPKSRFYGVLDWFDTLELEWSEARAPRIGGSMAPPGLGTLRAGDVVDRRRAITRELDAYRAGQTMVELLEIATRAGFADAELFTLGVRGLDALDAPVGALAVDDPTGRTSGATGTLAAFELKLLRALGLAPALEQCASCGAPAETALAGGEDPRVYFSAQAGGRLCEKHAMAAHASGLRVGTLPQRVLELAARLAALPLASSSEARAIDEPQAERVLDFASRFLDHHLETRPRSHRRFLAAPDRNRRQDERRTNGPPP